MCSVQPLDSIHLYLLMAGWVMEKKETCQAIMFLYPGSGGVESLTRSNDFLQPIVDSLFIFLPNHIIIFILQLTAVEFKNKMTITLECGGKISLICVQVFC